MNDSSGQHPTRPRGSDADDRLDSWKEIAAYLERTVTTLERWEKREGLPIHRHIHDRRGTVLRLSLRNRTLGWPIAARLQG